MVLHALLILAATANAAGDVEFKGTLTPGAPVVLINPDIGAIPVVDRAGIVREGIPAIVGSVVPLEEAMQTAALTGNILFTNAPLTAPTLALLPEKTAAQAREEQGPQARATLERAVATNAEGSVVFDHAKTPLDAAREAMYAVSGGSYRSGDVAAAKMTLAERTAYFKSPEFKNWVASEKAQGRQVFWLKDIDKTQASGDIFTYFFKWRADHDKFLPEQNQIMRDYLKTVKVKSPALAAEIAKAATNSAPRNADLVIKLWRATENGVENAKEGYGVGLLDFWKLYWKTQEGLTKFQKLRQVAAFAKGYGQYVYPGIPEDNKALAEAGVEVVAVSNGDQELAIAAAPALGIKRENVVGANLLYGPGGKATGRPHAYEFFDKEWAERPQPGKPLSFHYWVNANQQRWGIDGDDSERIVIAGADGDSASTDGGMWFGFKDIKLQRAMFDTPWEHDRIAKSQAMMKKYGWTKGQHVTITNDEAHSPKAWNDSAAPPPGVTPVTGAQGRAPSRDYMYDLKGRRGRIR